VWVNPHTSVFGIPSLLRVIRGNVSREVCGMDRAVFFHLQTLSSNCHKPQSGLEVVGEQVVFLQSQSPFLVLIFVNAPTHSDPFLCLPLDNTKNLLRVPFCCGEEPAVASAMILCICPRGLSFCVLKIVLPDLASNFESLSVAFVLSIDTPPLLGQKVAPPFWSHLLRIEVFFFEPGIFLQLQFR